MLPGLLPVAVTAAIVTVCWALRARDRARMFAEVNAILGRPSGRLR